jgi:hypothetical protein
MYTMLRDTLGDATALCKFLFLEVVVSTYVTQSGISAVSASSILFAASGGLYLGQIVSFDEHVARAFIRDEDGGCGSSSLFDAFFYGCENRLAQVFCTSLFWVCTPDDIGT